MAEDLCPVSSNDKFPDLSFQQSLVTAIYVPTWKHMQCVGPVPKLAGVLAVSLVCVSSKDVEGLTRAGAGAAAQVYMEALSSLLKI